MFKDFIDTPLRIKTTCAPYALLRYLSVIFLSHSWTWSGWSSTWWWWSGSPHKLSMRSFRFLTSRLRNYSRSFYSSICFQWYNWFLSLLVNYLCSVWRKTYLGHSLCFRSASLTWSCRFSRLICKIKRNLLLISYVILRRHCLNFDSDFTRRWG